MADDSVRDEELLYILGHLIKIRVHPDTVSQGENKEESALVKAIQSSPRALLFKFYPLLLELAFLSATSPRMWLLPSEHNFLYGSADGEGEADAETEKAVGISAGDAKDMIEVDARDLAKRCLELVGQEMGLSA